METVQTSVAGSGVADMEQVSAIKAQLLGFLLYGDPGSIQRILETFGTGEEGSSAEELRRLLPGPHPVLRCLVSVSAGEFQPLD
jgi:hypothetical protein